MRLTAVHQRIRLGNMRTTVILDDDVYEAALTGPGSVWDNFSPLLAAAA
jgi:hypothetical protein